MCDCTECMRKRGYSVIVVLDSRGNPLLRGMGTAASTPTMVMAGTPQALLQQLEGCKIAIAQPIKPKKWWE